MSLYRKMKQGKIAETIDNWTYNHFSKKRYRIHHRKLQKKDIAYNSDSIFVDMNKKNEDDEENIKEVGINKCLYMIDDDDNVDSYKD